MATPISDPQAVAFFPEAVLAETNRRRRAHGLRPLDGDRRLSLAALADASFQARSRRLGHDGAGWNGLGERLKTTGARFAVAAENIAMQKVYQIAGLPVTSRSVAAASTHPADGARNSQSARDAGCVLVYANIGQAGPTHTVLSLAAAVVDQWYASPKHRDNLLDPRLTKMGAGYGINPDGPACGDVYVTRISPAERRRARRAVLRAPPGSVAGGRARDPGRAW